MPKEIEPISVKRHTNYFFHAENEYQINGEGVHAWRSKYSADYDLTGLPGKIVVKAIIPKGTRFCFGNNDDIAAEQIFLSEIVLIIIK